MTYHRITYVASPGAGSQNLGSETPSKTARCLTPFQKRGRPQRCSISPIAKQKTEREKITQINRLQTHVPSRSSTNNGWEPDPVNQRPELQGEKNAKCTEIGSEETASKNEDPLIGSK